MNSTLKLWSTCIFAVMFSVSVFAASAQPIDAKVSQMVLIASEDQKKPAQPGSKPNDEEEGGCKC